MLAKAEELANDINNTGADIATTAANDGAEVKQSGLTKRDGNGLNDDVSPSVAAALFSLEDGKAKALQTSENVIIVKLDDIKAANTDTADAAPVTDELKQAINQDILAQYLDYLNEEISVSINNSVINELYAPAAAN